MEENQFKSENEELLEVVVAEGGTEPRRNTKKDLIGKIKTLCQDNEITLTESDTTLQRSSKVKLQKLLAAKTEELIEKKMKHTIRNQHIEDSECAREHMAVATLQYGLNVLNKMIDRGANTILPRAGYKLDGFCDAFEDERTKNEVREILLCICRENPEIITHKQSLRSAGNRVRGRCVYDAQEKPTGEYKICNIGTQTSYASSSRSCSSW